HREQPGTARPVASDIPALPPMREWVNVHTLGVKGDGADDTTALQAAIDRHRVLYLPSGDYRVTSTLHLRPDSALIGLNPATTEILVTDDAAKFTGQGDAVPVIESARGGDAILSGFAIATSFMDRRATGLVWRAGPHSMVEDVNLRAGFGRRNAVLGPNLPTPPQRRFDRTAYLSALGSQDSSLWVKDGGGGIFRGIWTSNSLAKSGLLVENSATPSVVYQLSCEHHMRHETQFYHASNWTVYALQTEEENPAGVDSFSVDLKDAHRFLFANTFMYRVSRQVLPKLNAVEAADSSAIQFENVHTFSMTRLAYDNSVFDSTADVSVRAHDFTAFALNAAVKPGPPLPMPAGVFAPGARLEKLASGFSNADGLTVDDAGNLYFTDEAKHLVYRWNADANKAEVLTDQVEMPMAAAYAGNGTLLVIDYRRSVYAVDTRTGATKKIDPADVPENGTNLVLPVGLHNSIQTLEWQLEHRGYVYAPRSNMATVGIAENQPRSYFYAPGAANAIVVGGNWLPQLQASQWRLFHVGDEHMVVSEDDDVIDRVKLETLEHATATEFALRGGASVVSDSAGNVYAASGQLYVYDASGRQIGVVEIPERPGSLAFGGPDGKTLFIGARGSLFSLRTVAAGR
ncbi:MAG: glycosyl hydrolase family 28-related protein, partial [Acidobacteriota bacterium]